MESLQNSQLIKQKQSFSPNKGEMDQNELLDGQSTEIDNYVYKKDLGKGIFGNVIRVKNKFTRYQYAMKIVEMPAIEVEKKVSQMIICIYQFQHLRNIVKIINYKIKDVKKNDKKKWIYILQELCQQNIKQEIDTRFSLNENNKTYYTENEMRNLINPLLVLFAKLQKFQIAHRSIKPENILRGFDNEIKISDFGCANPMMAYYSSDLKGFPNRDLKNLQSIPNYFSPERLNQWAEGKDIEEDQIYKSDVFSLGLVFVQIGNLSKLMLGANQNKGKLKNQIHQFSKRYSKQLTGLLKKMLEWDLRMRLDFESLIKLAQDQGFFSQRFSIFINDGSNSQNITKPPELLENKQVIKYKKQVDVQEGVITQLKAEIKKIKKNEQEMLEQMDIRSENNVMQQQKEKVIFYSNEIDILIQYLKQSKVKKCYAEIKLDFQYSEELLHYSFPAISQELKDNQNIRKLIIDLEGLDYEDQEMKTLFTNIQTLKSLEHFELVLDATEIEDNVLSSIVTNLYEKENLHTLIVNCRETNITTGKGLHKLSNVLRTLPNLRVFKLELYCTETNSESVLNIFNALSDCKNLQKVFIGLGETQITDSVKKIGKLISTYPSLRSFEVYFGETKVSDETFKCISSSFLNIYRMEELKLNFGQTQILNNQGMVLLSETLSTLVNLQKFDIEVYQTCINDKGLKLVFKSLAELEKLKSLSFGLGETQINEIETSTELGRTIKGLGMLREFTIVAFKTNINDEGFLNLMEAFQNKDQLKSLVVSFGRSKIINDESFLVFNDIFENKNELTKLNCFFQQTKIKNEGLLHFGNALKHLISLKEASFHFGELEISSDTGFLSIIEAIKNMQDLAKLQFFLYGTHVAISKESVKSFIKVVSEHGTLRELRHKINSKEFGDDDAELEAEFGDLEIVLDERMLKFKDEGEDLTTW